MSEAPPQIPDEYAQALTGVGSASLSTLALFEAVQRRLHPPSIPALREKVEPARTGLTHALETFSNAAVPDGLEELHDCVRTGAGHALDALEKFLAPSPPERLAVGVLAAMRSQCRAQETFYPLRLVLPPLGRFFAEPGWYERLAELDPDPPDPAGVGIHHARSDTESERGGFWLYVPERYQSDRDWPLVVALHGGFGHGRDFLWTWLREARSRGFLLLAPDSRGNTWALESPQGEARALASMVDNVSQRFRVDRKHVLLTGLSDGATFTYLAGLSAATPFTALAPVSGVLHPAIEALGLLEHARGRRIYLVHGALDWMFPVFSARMARDTLEAAGADLAYREIEDLSHTYPREENANILAWFDPSLT